MSHSRLPPTQPGVFSPLHATPSFPFFPSFPCELPFIAGWPLVCGAEGSSNVCPRKRLDLFFSTTAHFARIFSTAVLWDFGLRICGFAALGRAFPSKRCYNIRATSEQFVTALRRALEQRVLQCQAFRLSGARPVQRWPVRLPERPPVVVRVLRDAHSCACRPS